MKKALIIGISDYSNNPLPGAVRDAKELADILAINGNDTRNFEIQLKLNPTNKGQLINIIKEFYNLEADIGLLYFAGHGFVNEIGGYLVTPDHSLYDEGITMDQILGFANKSPIRNKVIILDCCKSGSFGSPSDNGSITPIDKGISIMTACRDKEKAKEINGKGVFTNLLIEGLKGGAADIRGHISPGGLYAYVDQALGAHEQRPVFKTNVTEFVDLRSIEPQVKLSTLRNICKYFQNPNSIFYLDPSFEDTNSNDVIHQVIEPFADENNVKIFKDLQKMQSVGLLVPIDEEYMYYAAMNSKSCKLTPLGHHYWRLVREGKI